MPAAPSLTLHETTLTYGELDGLAGGIAAQLVRADVQRGDLVAVCVAREQAVPAILGVLKAGAAYVPLDPRYPDARLAHLLDRVAARVVVADDVGAARIRACGAEQPAVVAPDRTDDARSFGVDVAPDDVAYVMFTSGSSGPPKGVQVTHRNVTRLMRSAQPLFGFGSGDVWTLFHSYAFDFSVWEMWGALLFGGRLAVVSDDDAHEPEALLELLEREGVTVLNQTPSALVELIEAEARRGAQLEHLRLIVLGGERLDPASLAGWFGRRGDARPRVFNMYGITETTVHVTYRRITRDDVRGEGDGRSPIGRPLPGMAITLRDEHGVPTPPGGVGEICVAGSGVAVGYLDDHAATAQRFRDVDWGDGDCRRTYFSGDLARDAGTGELDYIGRLDNQVKVRAYRIELGEVAAVLKSHPDVVDAYVSTDTGTSTGSRLLGWAVLRSAGSDVADLRAFLRERLPDYSIPGELHVVERLPLTVNGKVDRSALLGGLDEPAHRPASESPRGEPASSLEETVAGIWAETLGVERVLPNDDFFSLGGDSVLVLKAVARVREAVGVELRARHLFMAPRLREFVASVRAAGGG